ncbi:helix-turn-helix domain-containing protein [Carboxylicivirga sp. RSCT41]|uniref:helix-turn-helix domain-containing protein n=1 Tax=Carboxylicivirga agarovorans TaxID=3417570 RepID=UPI003D33C27F
MERLGERIKERREALGLSLGELSNAAGVSASLLSQIEHKKASPSLNTLKSIANSLNTTIGALVGEKDTINRNPVVRHNKKKLIKQTEYGAILYQISDYSLVQSIETYLVRLESQGHCKDLTDSTRHAQEFCYILSGVIEISLNGKLHVLNQGDSIYFDSNELETIVNMQNGVSDFLWMIAPDKL